MKTFMLTIALMGCLIGSLQAGNQADQNLIRWCIHDEVARVAALPRVLELRQIVSTTQNEALRQKAAAMLQRYHALAVQAGYNEAQARIKARVEAQNAEFWRVYDAEQFSRALVRNLRANF